jgi:uncharacterized membrane protein YdcZ (DUF606 family)
VRQEILYAAIALVFIMGLVVAGVIVALRTRSHYFGSDDSPQTLRKKHPWLALIADIIGVLLLVLAVWYIATRP